MGISRRDFVKGTILAGAAAAAGPTLLVRKAPAGWAKKTIVHPNVNNLRVVGITDPKMTKETAAGASWEDQQGLVVSEKVWENLDQLASGLIETKDPKDAWKGIFIKPFQKSWSDTVVAIKTNNIGMQHTRSAVMAKVCHTLVDVVGIKPHNVCIYDGKHGQSINLKTPFAGLPKGVRILKDWGGISTPVAVPSPWTEQDGKSEALKALADGTVDILVNISLCKGHWVQFGGFTMATKNHMGTFNPYPAHQIRA
jgi:TAT (twin-arginine translocation) pathway signal sequence